MYKNKWLVRKPKDLIDTANCLTNSRTILSAHKVFWEAYYVIQILMMYL